MLFRSRVPFTSNTLNYSEEDEAWMYNGAKAWSFGAGSISNIDSFKTAYNLVYQCSNRLKPFNGSSSELSAQYLDYRNEQCEFWIAKHDDIEYGNVYYYDSSSTSFKASDIGNGVINLFTQLVNKGYGLDSSDIIDKSLDELNELFIKARIEKFREEAPDYWDIEDALLLLTEN